MAWPPIIPPNNRTDETVQDANHPSDHNLISDALTELTTRANAMAISSLLAEAGDMAAQVPSAVLSQIVWTDLPVGDGGISYAANQWTIFASGVYRLTYNHKWVAAGLVGVRGIYVRVDGVVVAGQEQVAAEATVAAQPEQRQSMSVDALLTGGQVVDFACYQTSGVDVSTGDRSAGLSLSYPT